jgi:radical SAM superfamily enzyme YgiQ (UPF0313 family)
MQSAQKHNAATLERTINDPVSEMISQIYLAKTDVLGLSCYIWNQSQIHEILRDIKKIMPKLIIVCGGPDISYNPEKWLAEFPNIDFIICGPGEKAMHTLAEKNFKYPQKIIKMDNYPFSQIPVPYHYETDNENLTGRYLYYETSRGCPSSCSYCVSSIADQKLEYKPIETVKFEILTLLKFEPLIIKFVDRSFNSDEKRCIEIIKFIDSLKTNVKFHIEINPYLLTDGIALAILQARNNKLQIEVGIQTTKNGTYPLINRPGTWGEIRKKLVKIPPVTSYHSHYDMIVGLPNETKKDIEANFSKIIKLEPDHFQVGFLKILPGTHIEREVEKYDYKYQEKAPYRIISSNKLSYEDILCIEAAELALELTYNNRILSEYMRYLIRTSENMYAFFEVLGVYFTNNKVNKAHTNRTKIFELVVKNMFRTNFFDDEAEYLMDCIRYDWFIRSDTHFYPDFLRAKHCDVLKSDFYVKFKDKWQTLQQKKTGSDYPEKLKNAVFFTNKDNDFKPYQFDRNEGMVKVGDDFYVFEVDKADNIVSLKAVNVYF